MLNALFTKIFGSRNERVVKKMGRVVDLVNAFEEALQALSDEELKAKTAELRKRFEGGETLDDLLPEAFAVVREATVERSVRMKTHGDRLDILEALDWDVDNTTARSSDYDDLAVVLNGHIVSRVGAADVHFHLAWGH